MNNSRIIVSLDYADVTAALHLVDQLENDRCRLKIGKEMFTHYGPGFVAQLIDRGFDVFLDLKFHDIPNTVSRACKIAADMGVWMLNVHASGGSEMMASAREGIEQSINNPMLIAVTVLTSLADADLNELGIEPDTNKQVTRLAKLAAASGLDGVVCSAHESRNLRKVCGNDFRLVTPGIRPAASAGDDQKRVMTPAEAIAAGSDYLVIGRPITQSADPQQALLDIESEINRVL